MTIFKEADLLMLPSKDGNGGLKSGIYMDAAKKFHPHNVTNGGRQQHLYFLSPEKIELNDWISDGYKVWQWKDDSSLLGRKKIIGTTDRIIVPCLECRDKSKSKWMQGPTDIWTRWYINELNNNHFIEKVMIEYRVKDDWNKENPPFAAPYIESDSDYIINVASDNTINIQPIMESWDQVISTSGVSSSDYYFQRLVEHLKQNYNPPTKKK